MWGNVLFTCVILAFLTGCRADRLHWLAEDQRRPLTLTGTPALGWTRSCPGDGSQAQTQTSARAQETAAPSGLSSRPGLQHVLSRAPFQTSRSSHLEIKIMKMNWKILSVNYLIVTTFEFWSVHHFKSHSPCQFYLKSIFLFIKLYVKSII